jgi:hypothetical protein
LPDASEMSATILSLFASRAVLRRVRI